MDAFGVHIFERVSKLLDNISRLSSTLAKGPDAEAIHDMRVASRRLRAVLNVFRPSFAPADYDRLRKGFRRITRRLGQPREWDVTLELLSSFYESATNDSERCGVEFVREWALRKRRKAQRELERGLSGMRLERWSERLALIFRSTALVPGGVAVGTFAWGVFEPLARAAFSELDAIRKTSLPEQLHEMRIAVKKLRYAVETLEPAFVSKNEHDEILQDLRELQSVLGDHHDISVLEGVVQDRLVALRESGCVTLAANVARLLESTLKRREELTHRFQAMTAELSLPLACQRIASACGVSPS